MINKIELKIILNETEVYKNKPLFEVIVSKAAELKLAGVTVYRGTLGFGKNIHLHNYKILSLSENLPIIIEIIDDKENIDKIIPFIKESLSNGIATLSEVKRLALLNE